MQWRCASIYYARVPAIASYDARMLCVHVGCATIDLSLVCFRVFANSESTCETGVLQILL